MAQFTSAIKQGQEEPPKNETVDEIMAFTLLLLVILLSGLILVVIGGVLLGTRKSKLVGFIVLGAGLVMTLLSIFAFLFLVIALRSMG